MAKKERTYRWWVITFVRTDVLGKKSRRQEVYCADTKEDLAEIRPMRRGETLVKISETTGFSAWVENKRNRVNRLAVNTALGECADLLEGGVRMDDAVAMQMRRTTNPIVRYHLFRVVRSLRLMGMKLHAAFAREPEICDERLEAILRVADVTAKGTLAESLRELKKESAYTSFVRGILIMMAIYPYLMLWGLAALTFLLMVKIIPTIGKFYRDFDGEILWFAVPHFAIGEFVARHPWVYLVTVVPALLAIGIFHTQILDWKWVQRIVYALPLFGRFLVRNEVCVAVSHLAVSLRAGQPMVESMELTNDLLKKPNMRRAWAQVAQESRNGIPTGKSFESLVPEFGDMGEEVAAMIQIGEASNKMPEQIAAFAQRLRDRMHYQAAALEKQGSPLVTVFVMVAAAFVILPVQLTMMQMGAIIGNKKGADRIIAPTAVHAPAILAPKHP